MPFGPFHCRMRSGDPSVVPNVLSSGVEPPRSEATEPNTPDVAVAIDAFVGANSLEEMRAVFEANQTTFHTKEALKELQARIASSGDHPHVLVPSDALLETPDARLRFLDTALRRGITAALTANLRQIMAAATAQQPTGARGGIVIPSSLQPLIRAAAMLRQPGQQPQRVKLLEQALRRVEAGEGDRMLWAALQSDLGNALEGSRLAPRAESLERALACFSAACTVYTRNTHPFEWALVQINLGNLYRERIRGDRAENLEQAISSTEAALDVVTRQAYPDEWADAKNGLGAAYRHRLCGDRAENLEQAIACYEAALTIHTRERYPQAWALTQTNRGNVYRERIRGDRAENLEQAIACYEAALTVRTRERYPVEWAFTQANLGTAYHRRLHGDSAENLERAVAAYNAALTVCNREAHPVDWAGIQLNLGNTYADRLRGDREENLEQAIACYEAARDINTREACPIEWAETQLNLGTAYADRLRGDREENLEQAIDCYTAALTVYVSNTFPVDWAHAHANLGTAYGNLLGDRHENLERALAFYDAALTVCKRDTFPRDFRDTQFARGQALEALGRLPEAHAAYEMVRETQRDLFTLAPDPESLTADIAQWADQNVALRDARVLLRLPLPDLISVAEVLEEERARALRTALDLDNLDPTHLEDPCARERAEMLMHDLDAWRNAQHALEATEGGELAARNIQRTELHQAHAAFLKARDSIREYDDPDFLSPTVRLADLAKALSNGGFAPDQALVYVASGPEAGLALILSLENDSNLTPMHIPLPTLTESATDALQETYAKRSRSIGEVTRKISQISGGLVQAQMSWAFNNLLAWGVSVRDVLTQLPPESGFTQALLQVRATWEAHPKLRENLRLLEMPFDALSDVEHDTLDSDFTDALLRLELARSLEGLGELGFNTLTEALVKQGIRRVVLIPYGRLALFPLPAVVVTDPTTGESTRFGERFEVTIAPSGKALAMAQARSTIADQARHQPPPGWRRQALLAVGNPLPLPNGLTPSGAYIGSLKFAGAEADSLKRIATAFHYPSDQILTYIGRQAKRSPVLTGLARAWYAHLAMHGRFDPAKPRNSRLVLGGDGNLPEAERTLTLGECLDGDVRLEGLRLLVLSACETSLIEARRAANEVIGLPAAFLQAGAAGVVAALWPVYDDATFLLMTRFLQLYLDPGHNWSPAHCLADAQHWLREEATNAAIAAYFPNQPAAESEREPAPVDALGTYSTSAQVLVGDEGAKRSLSAKRISQATALVEVIHTLAHDDPEGRPFADPIYWAAFMVTGC